MGSFLWPHCKITEKSNPSFITCSGFYAHTEPLFKRHKLLKVHDLLHLKALKFYYRYSQNQLPRFFDNMFSALPVSHTYLTRYREVPRYPLPSRQTTQNCIRYYIPSLISETPVNITEKINTHSYSGFSKYVKLFLAGKYSETCTIPNWYVCNS